MPTYEYKCESCEAAWEAVQRITEEPLKKCPECGKDTAKRQIGASTFLLQGGGWYADGYSRTDK